MERRSQECREGRVLWLLSPFSLVTIPQGETKRELCVLRVRLLFPCQGSRLSLLQLPSHRSCHPPNSKALTVRPCPPECLASFHRDQQRVLDIHPSPHSNLPHTISLESSGAHLCLLLIPVCNITPSVPFPLLPHSQNTSTRSSGIHTHPQQSPHAINLLSMLPFPSCSY